MLFFICFFGGMFALNRLGIWESAMVPWAVACGLTGAYSVGKMIAQSDLQQGRPNPSGVLFLLGLLAAGFGFACCSSVGDTEGMLAALICAACAVSLSMGAASVGECTDIAKKDDDYYE